MLKNVYFQFTVPNVDGATLVGGLWRVSFAEPFASNHYVVTLNGATKFTKHPTHIDIEAAPGQSVSGFVAGV